jgi:hypothetical protein
MPGTKLGLEHPSRMFGIPSSPSAPEA